MNGASSASGLPLSAQREVDEDPTPTQKIWRPVSDLDIAQQQAFRELAEAMSRFDMVKADAARTRIQAIENEQKQAHAAARAYLLQRVHR
jgi:hypothetical protein